MAHNNNARVIKTYSVSDMYAFAQNFAEKRAVGGVLLLFGGLGAGKTTFVQGLAKALGVKDVVTSPTFVLMKSYATADKRVKQLVHIDAYRLDAPHDIALFGLEEELYDKDKMVCIEWPERLRLPKDIVPVRMTFRIAAKGVHEIRYEG